MDKVLRSLMVFRTLQSFNDVLPRSACVRMRMSTARVDFTVPKTRGFLEYFLQGRLHALDVAIIGSLTLGVACLLSGRLPRWCFLLAFMAWRLAYNVGLGWILRAQSERGWFTAWAQRHVLGECRGRGDDNGATMVASSPASTQSSVSPMTPPKSSEALASFLRACMLVKIDCDAVDGDGDAAGVGRFGELPPDYRAWLVFRMLVDVILFHDFACYLLMACAYGEPLTMGWESAMRLVGGLALVAFNAWVKSDAHRVVKDYAWYWGDFFFRLPGSSLTFDGVFELVPHPMYSLGYVGYYGISLLAGSYVVFYASLAAHFLQLAFLWLVESPHMDKIYGPTGEGETGDGVAEEEGMLEPVPPTTVSPASSTSAATSAPSLYQGKEPMFHYNRDMIVFWRFDGRRATDMMTLLFVAMAILVHAMGVFAPWAVVIECLLWRGVFSGLLGWILAGEDREQAWTRHYLRWGYSAADAFGNWKALYNFALLMNYTMYGLAAWYTYQGHLPGWTPWGTLLRHTLGGLMIGLQAWTGWEIFAGLGEFGWFYGDFFIQPAAVKRGRPVYVGIYRYLNNPERVVGQAAYWGTALICWDWRMVLLAAVATVSNWIFLEAVERPHMERIYGGELRTISGVSKTVRRALPRVLEEQGRALERVLEEPVALVREIIRAKLERLDRRGCRRENMLAMEQQECLSRLVLNKSSWEIGEPITFCLPPGPTNVEQGKIIISSVPDGRVYTCIDLAECEQEMATGEEWGSALLSIKSLHVPWLTGTFRVSLVPDGEEGGGVGAEGDHATWASTPFTIIIPPVSAELDMGELLSLLIRRAGYTLRQAQQTGPRHCLFRRLAEAIRCLWAVDFASATIYQYAVDSEGATLVEQIVAAQFSLSR